MNRMIVALAIVTISALGMTACSGDTAPAATDVQTNTPAPAPQESTPTQSTDLDPATLQACLDIAGPFAEASNGMQQLAGSGAASPQEVVDMWTKLVDALGSIADSTSNEEVKNAAAAAHTDFAALRDAMQRVYVDGDMSAMDDYTAATTAIQSSYPALLELCSV